MQEYEAKLEANKNLIHELGERVGQETKSRADLESQLQYMTAKSNDQKTQMERLEELNQVNTELINTIKKDQQENNTKTTRNNNNNNQNSNADYNNKW
jgi:hypothetical protein